MKSIVRAAIRCASLANISFLDAAEGRPEGGGTLSTRRDVVSICFERSAAFVHVQKAAGASLLTALQGAGIKLNYRDRDVLDLFAAHPPQQKGRAFVEANAWLSL